MPTPKPDIITVPSGTEPPPTPAVFAAAPSNFSSRRRDREAREAAGEVRPEPHRRLSQRAGADTASPNLVVRRVRQ